MNKVIYPFHDSLRSTWKTTDAALAGIRLLRLVAEEARIGLSEAEILIAIIPHLDPVSYDHIRQMMNHLSDDRVRRLIKLLSDRELIDISVAPNLLLGIGYHTTEKAGRIIRSFTLSDVIR